MTRASRREWAPSALTGIRPSLVTTRPDNNSSANVRTAPSRILFIFLPTARWCQAATGTINVTINKLRSDVSSLACDSTREMKKLAPSFPTRASNRRRPLPWFTTARPVSCVQTYPKRSSHFYVDAESVTESFTDNHRSRHFFMAIAAEDVA
jgi:hypothetical protein